MTQLDPKTAKAVKPLEEMGEVMRGMVDEARLQAHLGVMEAKAARPYLEEVAAAAKAAARDLRKRSTALKAQLQRLRREHRAR